MTRRRPSGPAPLAAVDAFRWLVLWDGCAAVVTAVDEADAVALVRGRELCGPRYVHSPDFRVRRATAADLAVFDADQPAPDTSGEQAALAL